MKRTVILGAFFPAFSWPLPAQQIFKVDDAVTERNYMPNELLFYIIKINSLSFWQGPFNEFVNRFERDSSYQNIDFQADMAIDQGPAIVMIANYRTGLLWNLFMSSPEVQIANTQLGFE